VNAFNLSAWAVKHNAVVLYLMLAVAAAGVYAYLGMGRAEDPPFTIKTMVVSVDRWKRKPSAAVRASSAKEAFSDCTSTPVTSPEGDTSRRHSAVPVSPRNSAPPG